MNKVNNKMTKIFNTNQERERVKAHARFLVFFLKHQYLYF